MKDIEESQKSFYLKNFLQFGPHDARSLSWNDMNSQFLRFKKITELFKYETDPAQPFTIHEIGCGLGHFKKYLELNHYNCLYSGSDILPEYIESNRRQFNSEEFYLQSICEDYDAINPQIIGKDYYCLSGTFHTKEHNTIDKWENFIFKSISNMFRMAIKGIAFNFLTSHSDFYQETLYYVYPSTILTYMIENYSRFVCVLHDIPLFEFTVLAYKKDFIKKIFPDYEKYLK